MKLLVLGGTQFVGRAIVEILVEKGHEVVLFTRGQTNPGLFSNLRKIQGDRLVDLSEAATEDWDAVIDVSGYVVKAANKAVEAFRDKAKHYVFISTISVIDVEKGGIHDENAPRLTMENLDDAEVSAETYGPLKTRFEDILQEGFPGRLTIIRPGLVAGPNDPTDRFTLWATLTESNERFPAPPNPDQPIQWVDVRDLAAFTVNQIEATSGETFVVVGPEKPITFREFLHRMNPSGQPVWITEEQYTNSEAHLPMALPSTHLGIFQVDQKKALAAGLRLRSLEETLADTRAFAKTLDRPLKTKLPDEVVSSWLS